MSDHPEPVSPSGPVRHDLVVPAPPAIAFDVFTHGIDGWWPLSTHSVHGADARVAFAEGRIVESLAGAADSVWGTVLEWEPASHTAFTWHPGRRAANPSRVVVSFEAVDGGTAVHLTHAGWESYADPRIAREEYERDWPVVLGAYAAAFPVTSWTWVALLHTPTISGDVFEDPRFAGHVEFLGRMTEAGYLVAAGPLLDRLGAGMTILRLPGDDRLADARTLATATDSSVTDGLFDVTVRPWLVVTSTVAD